MSGSAHRSASALTVRAAVTYDRAWPSALVSRGISRGNARRDYGSAISDRFRGLRMGTEPELQTPNAESPPAASAPVISTADAAGVSLSSDSPGGDSPGGGSPGDTSGASLPTGVPGPATSMRGAASE